ncbi:MAG: hypothetical protein ACFE78_14065, partial [Candidatus Hodarchaeota archaeon]
IIFGILPIFPLMAYMDISRFLVDVPVHHQISIFIKSLTFEIFFTLQFLDFFLMGIFNLINIMSGEIFEWFKTLPLPRKKLKRLAFITIFHNFDLPIMANIFVFPVMMLFATQNIIIFLVSLGTSIMNITFSISILIILGEKVARLIKRQNLKAKKSLFVQILNTFSYAIIIFGSILVIQIILSSMAPIIVASLNLYRSPLYNAILSLIPFPFNPSYLISLFTVPSEIQVPYWLNPLFGLGLYLIVIYVLFRKALKSLNNIISLKYKFNKNVLSGKKDELRIHTSSKIKAFIRKDLIIASRNIQTFMSFIMPIIMSFVFMIFFNISFTDGVDLLSRDLYYSWIVLLGFSLVLSGMTVYNLLNMEATGRTIIGSLPIVFRDHAKAKLVILIIIQIIATLAPTLVYISHYRFIELLITVLATLPFVLIFLILTFLLRVRLFGKKRYSYVLEEILPENKMGKWALIFVFEYMLYYLIILISNFLYFSDNFIVLFLTLFTLSAIFTVILKSIFDKFFPKFREEKPLAKKRDSKFNNKRLLFTVIYIIYFFDFLTFSIVYNFFEILYFLGGLFILTGIILILVVIKSPKKKHENKSQQINLVDKKPDFNRRLLIISIRIIYLISSFIFILVYGFFLGGLFILVGFILILELIISSLNKNKKKFHRKKKLHKIFSIKKVDIVRYIANSFLKHAIIFFGILFLTFVLSRAMPIRPHFVYIPAHIRGGVHIPERSGPDYYYELGLHLPLWQQFFLYLGRLFSGNWGNTINRYGSYPLSPVKELILERVHLSMGLLIIPICLSLFLEINSFVRRNNNTNNFQKRFIRKISSISYSIPSFLLVIFVGYVFGNGINFELLTQLILAALILSLSMLSKMVIIKRRNTLFNDNYVNRGFRRSNRNNRKNVSTFKHKNFPNWFVSSIFIIPSIIISEIIIVEPVLSLQGLGSLFIEAMYGRDLFLIEAIVFIFTITIVSISFIQSLLKLYFQLKNPEINEILKEKLIKLT